MLEKDEMIILIEAYEAMDDLDALVVEMTGSRGLSGGKYEPMFKISEILFKHCGFYADDTKAFERFYAIVTNDELTSEQKYQKMMER